MDSPVNKFSKLNDSIIKVLEKPIIKYGMLIIIIGQIIAIKELSTAYLDIFNNTYFKVIYAFVIAYYACFDPIYAIALTTLIIVSIQEIHRRNSNNSSTLLMETKNNNEYDNEYNSEINDNMMPINNNSVINSFTNSFNDFINTNNDDSMESIINYNNENTNKLLINDELVYETINKQSLQKQPDSNDNLKHEYEFCDEPAYKTITNNLNENYNNTIQEMQNIQNIEIQGLDEDMESIQGLPYGFDQKYKN